MSVKVKPPRALKKRLKAVAAKHDFDGVDAVVHHFIDRGLKQYERGEPPADLAARLDAVVDEQGYSSRDELIEHLLLRGLDAYEDAPDDPEKLRERLRGLGYIE
ncbi:MAG: hypothetical protein D6689_17815 [Deltaproteobacteria bacterium]|nr:MAG: hypothetical protein D6689_17815 [Deltaproteobacteria bacterium]